MSIDLKSKLENVTNLPSPPGVAAQVVQLAQNPDLDLGSVAEVITRDPSLTAKILRVANSPMYAQRRKSNNLRQALVVLGMNATVTLALGFSLLPVLRSHKSGNDHYTHIWRRAVLSAVAGRTLAGVAGLTNPEDAFLACLLQDIGVLAIDRVEPGFYQEAGDLMLDHDRLVAYEKEHLGADHADVGVWLLDFWNIPNYLQDAVRTSHALEDSVADSEPQRFARCVALSGIVADLWLADTGNVESFIGAATKAEQLLGLDRVAFGSVMQSVHDRIPETETLFETDIIDETQAELIAERAHEALTIRNLQSIREAAAAGQKAKAMTTLARDLEAKNRQDALTRIANRGYLDTLLEKGFAHASRFGWPFSVAFIDLDHFKSINDTFGHQAGDDVLRQTAMMLANQIRASDSVGRYGGEEFLLLLPGADPKGADVVGQRILAAMRALTFEMENGESIVVTASCGIASMDTNNTFPTAEEFIRAADQALYAAKAQGRDQVVHYKQTPQADAVSG